MRCQKKAIKNGVSCEKLEIESKSMKSNSIESKLFNSEIEEVGGSIAKESNRNRKANKNYSIDYVDVEVNEDNDCEDGDIEADGFGLETTKGDEQNLYGIVKEI